MTKRDNKNPNNHNELLLITQPLRIDEIIKLIFSSEKEALIRFVNNVFNRSHDIHTAVLEYGKSE